MKILQLQHHFQLARIEENEQREGLGFLRDLMSTGTECGKIVEILSNGICRHNGKIAKNE